MMCKYSHYFNSHEMMRRFFIVNHDNYDSRTDFTTHPCVHCEYGTVIKGHTPTSGSNVGVIVGRKPASSSNVGSTNKQQPASSSNVKNYCRQDSASSSNMGSSRKQPPASSSNVKNYC